MAERRRPRTNGADIVPRRAAGAVPSAHGRNGSADSARESRWAVLIVVALIALKFAFGLVIGLIQSSSCWRSWPRWRWA